MGWYVRIISSSCTADCGNKPVYYNGAKYLYFSPAWASWVTDSTAGSSSVGFKCNDQVDTPDLVTSDWEEWSDGAWVTSAAKAECAVTGASTYDIDRADIYTYIHSAKYLQMVYLS